MIEIAKGIIRNDNVSLNLNHCHEDSVDKRSGEEEDFSAPSIFFFKYEIYSSFSWRIFLWNTGKGSI